MRKITTYLCVLTGALLMTGCRDNDILPPSQSDGITTDISELSLPVRSCYRTIQILPTDLDIKATTSEGWLEIVGDSISSEGCVEIFAERNENPERRTGVITLRGENDEEVEIRVTQSGYQDDDSNWGMYCYAGCGYNIFQELNSESSICEPVLDYATAITADPYLIQTTARNQQDIRTITSNSTVEMAQLMTQSMEKVSTGLLGGKKTATRFETSNSQTQLDVTNYAYINLQRVVASSSLDVSRLMQYAEQSRFDIFTPEFRKHYDRILANPTRENIQEMYKVFGTHIVTYVDLGGTMDIALSFNKTMKGELNLRATDFIQYFFKSQPSDYTLNGSVQGLSTKVSNKGTFKIAGGSALTRAVILDDCSKAGKINPAHIQDWSRSLPQSDFMKTENLAKIAPLNIQLVPIWSVFPARLSSLFLECAIAESQKSSNAIDDAAAGLDNYGIRISGAPFMDFADNEEESLVRVVYANQSSIAKAAPVLEICNEYVPSVKGSKRITVIYPIRNGRPFHGSGLFPGDGEGTSPAWLTFSDGDVYVKPIEGTNDRTVIDSVYYLHGNIYLTSLGLDLKQSVATDWKAKGVAGLPIVKIGSGYWTRRNVDTDLATGYYVGANFRRGCYRTTDGEYWVHIRSLTNPKLTPPGVGNAVDEIYDQPLQWYYPTEEARHALMEYVNYDLRHLLKSQLSGFDLQFKGYYGPGGIDGVAESSTSAYRNTDRCYLIFKDRIDSETGSAVCVDGDYRWRLVKTGNGMNNFFPLRLYRSSYYIYDNYSNAKNNL